MMDLNEQKKHWTAEARKELKGKTIKDAVYVTDPELKTPILIILLDDGTQLYPMQDDEGNGPGALHGERKENFFITHSGFVLPTLR